MRIYENEKPKNEFRAIPQLCAYYAVIGSDIMSIPMLEDGSIGTSAPTVVDDVEWEESSLIAEYLNGVFYDEGDDDNSVYFKWSPQEERLVCGDYPTLFNKGVVVGELYLDPFNSANKKDFPFLCSMYDSGDTGYTRCVFEVYAERFDDAFNDATNLKEQVELKREYVLAINTVGGDGYIEIREYATFYFEAQAKRKQ
jgi:hypothetical protein